MATDVLLDPTTRDFVDTANGDWEETDDARTAVFCQLESRERRWWGDAKAGSQNAEILESELPTADQLLDSTSRAMNALVGAGAISNLSVVLEDEDSERGFAGFLLQWRDRTSNKPADLAYSPLGSKPL